MESTQSIRADYLSGQTEVIPKMRAVLIDWLVGVHLQFHLLQETLYTTVAILDRYSAQPVSTSLRVIEMAYYDITIYFLSAANNSLT